MAGSTPPYGGGMREDETMLRPATENPWYVLMTLYGETEESDLTLHAKNRAAWNAWACQGLNQKEKQHLSQQGFTIPNATLWRDEGDSIQALYRAEMVRRNPEGFEYPGFPDLGINIEMTRLTFDHDVFAGGFLFPANSTRFLESRFRKVSFQKAVFTGGAWFERSVFEGIA